MEYLRKNAQNIFIIVFFSVIIGTLSANIITPPDPMYGVQLVTRPSQETIASYWNELFLLDIAYEAEFVECNPQFLESIYPEKIVFHLKIKFPDESTKKRFYKSVSASGWESEGGEEYEKITNDATLKLKLQEANNIVTLDMKKYEQ